jgi:hypothetical protein
VEDIVSRKTYQSTIAILLVVAALFVSTMPAYANVLDDVLNSSKYEQGGIWANVLRPYAYYPNAGISLPETAVSEQVVGVQNDLAATALLAFTSSVLTGNDNMITGVFADKALAYPVVQQPSGSAAFVSTQSDVVTQFALASQYGTIGILAHNNLAGNSFFDLSFGEDVYVVYGDGETAHYIVKEIRQFQALSPYSPYSEFIDIDTNARYTSSSLFYEVYGRSDTLVLQTCIAANGVDSWGRLFIIAELVY